MSAAPSLSAVYAQASTLVAQVLDGRSLASQGTAFGAWGPMRGATIDMVQGTLRRYGRGDAILARLAHRGVPETRLRALLLCALHAIESAHYAEHVAVDQAVRACSVMGNPAARRFVNAVLRSFLRERAVLDAALAEQPPARWMHPPWWIDMLRAAYPHDWEAVLAMGNAHPPMALRVNNRKSSTGDYLVRLEAEGMAAKRVGASALLLDTPVGVQRLPGFAEGAVSVQDAGAQRAASYLDVSSGQRVLDACAAPGGKACHLLESADLDLLALDADEVRCERIAQNFARLGLQGRIVAADCARTDDWWDGQPFDRILADVPCSASGIVRRHPDIKWLRRPRDAGQFATAQVRILEALWQVLAPGGKLLYVTCSVFPEENAGVVEAFCALQPAARRLNLADGEPAQLLPGTDNDGFYFALLQK